MPNNLSDIPKSVPSSEEISSLLKAVQGPNVAANTTNPPGAFVTLDQAATQLNIDVNQLKMLENQGKIKPIFTQNGQNQYVLDDIKKASTISGPVQQTNNKGDSKNHVVYNILFFLVIAAIIIIIIILLLLRRGGWSGLSRADKADNLSFSSSFTPSSLDFLSGKGIKVIGGDQPTIVNTGVTSIGGNTGDIKVTNGSGISITNGNNTTTVTNTDKGTDQNIFKNVALGTSLVVAGSNNDTFTFGAGDNVSLSLDTTSKKLTISSSATSTSTSSNDSGWTDDGTIVRLTTISDNVGIGIATPTKKLDIVGDVKVSGTTTLNGTEYTWPGSDGTANYILATNGSGHLSWVVQSGGSGTVGWLLTGNGGTNPGTDFVGTIDAKALVFKTNGTETARFTSGGALWVSGDTTNGVTPTSGAGTRLMWIPAKGAFRAGVVSGTQWDNASIGTRSIALGENVTASGTNSISIGNSGSVSANSSTIIGYNNTVTGTSNNYAFGDSNSVSNFSNNDAFGQFNTVAEGGDNEAFGQNNDVSGSGNNHAFGQSNTISACGACSAFGFENTILGNGNNDAFGQNNYVDEGGDNEAFGQFNEVFGLGTSAAFGNSNSINGNGSSEAFGISNSITSGGTNFAFGDTNSIGNSGGSSYTFGDSNIMSGNRSYAIGASNTATSDDSYAMGKWTTTTAANSMAFGQGIDGSNLFTNNVASSIAFGVNSTIPTLFVGGGSGAATLGKVGIGTTAPSTGLSVVGTVSSAGSGIGTITNNNTTDSANTVTLRLNTGAAAGTGNARFITFYGGVTSGDSGGTAVGHINLSTNAVNYGTSGADFGERFYVPEQTHFGDLIGINDSGKNTLATTGMQLIGVVSDSTGFTGGDDDSLDKATNPIVGLIGQVRTKVSIENGQIHKGDYLTASSIPGVAMKATAAGQVIGKALEDYSGSDINRIEVFVNAGYADPNNSLANLMINPDGTLDHSITAGSKLLIPTTSKPGLECQSTAATDPCTFLVYQTQTYGANSAYALDVAASLRSLDLTLADLSGRQASNSAEIAQLKKQSDVLASQVASNSASLTNAVNSTSGKITDLQTQIDSLLSSVISKEATGSAEPNTQGITPPDVLLSSSATPVVDSLKVSSDATISGKLTAYQASVSDTLKSLGETFLGKTTVAGDISIGGTLSITGNSLNSIAPNGANLSNGVLFIQNSPLASLVDFFNGKVTIDKDGKVSVTKLEVASTSLGRGIINTGSNEVEVKTLALTDRSHIFLSAESEVDSALFISEKESGSGFKVKTKNPAVSDISFSWWIVDEK